MATVNKEQLVDACKKAAKSLGMVSAEEFMGQVWRTIQEEYDKEDIASWFEDQGLSYTDEDVDKVYEIYRYKYDCDYGTWDNIAAAYDYCGLNLEYKEDEE